MAVSIGCALMGCFQVSVELTEYSLSAVTEGIDALACTRVMLRPGPGTSSVTTHSQLGDVQRTFRYAHPCTAVPTLEV